MELDVCPVCNRSVLGDDPERFEIADGQMGHATCIMHALQDLNTPQRHP